MKSSLSPGLEASRRITVDEGRCIAFMGEDCRVYATPRIISDVEHTCRDVLLRHLDPGEDSVGTRVSVEHVGPALFGADVAIDVRVVAVDGRRVTFEAMVKDGDDEVLKGTHERFVVAVDKVRERLLKRKARAQ